MWSVSLQHALGRQLHGDRAPGIGTDEVNTSSSGTSFSSLERFRSIALWAAAVPAQEPAKHSINIQQKGVVLKWLKPHNVLTCLALHTVCAAFLKLICNCNSAKDRTRALIMQAQTKCKMQSFFFASFMQQQIRLYSFRGQPLFNFE